MFKGIICVLLSLFLFNFCYIYADEVEEPVNEETKEVESNVSEETVQDSKKEEVTSTPNVESTEDNEDNNANDSLSNNDLNENQEKLNEVPDTNTNLDTTNDDEVITGDTPNDKTGDDDIHGGEIYDIQKVKVLTIKLDENGNPLEGAKLQILNSNGKVVDEWTSTTEVHETLLPDGNYTLHEVEAPEGYDLADDKPFEVKVKIADLDANVDFSEEPCEHYGGTPLYYVKIEGKIHEVYCINQDWETPDGNSSYDGGILNSNDIRDYTQQTVYVDAHQNKDKIDVSDQSLESDELYDKILDIIYHRHKAAELFPDLSEAEIRYVTESALKNYTNAGLTRVQRVSVGSEPTGYNRYDSYTTNNGLFTWYLYPWYRSFRYDPNQPLGSDIYVTDIGNGDAFGNIARHWSPSNGHNAINDPDVRKQIARYYELYLYLINDDEDDHHPEDMNLYIYSTTTPAESGSQYNFDSAAYQNLLGVTGYFEDIKQQEMELEMVNNYSTEKRDIVVTKIWDDNNNEEELRPENISVTLYKDGEEYETVILDESNNWKYTFTDLEKYDQGRKIIYTINEIEVPDYTTTITGNMEVGFTIKNSRPKHENPKTIDKIYYYFGLLMLSVCALFNLVSKYIKSL